jgi:hypothetical protein
MNVLYRERDAVLPAAPTRPRTVLNASIDNSLQKPLPSLQYLSSPQTIKTVTHTSSAPFVPGSLLDTSSKSPGAPTQYAVFASEDLESLQAQCNALTEAFLLQEHALDLNAKNQHIYALSHTMKTLCQFKQPTTALKAAVQPAPAEMKIITLTASDKDITSMKFPYRQLLTLWRNKVIQLHLQHALLQKQMQSVLTAQKATRMESATSQHQIENQLLRYKNINVAVTEQNQNLQKHVQHLQELVSQEQIKYRQVETQCALYHTTLYQLISYVQSFQQQYQAKELSEQHVYHHIIQQLQRYEAKIQALTGHLDFIKEIYHEKDIQLRNSYAALEAEKRLHHFHPNSNGAVREGSDEHVLLLSQVQLSCDAEALLRSIFCSVDSEDHGVVLLVAFLSMFIYPPHPTTSAAGARAAVPVAPAAAYAIKEGNVSYSLTELGVVAYQALGHPIMMKFLSSLSSLYQQDKSVDLTWGEVLLAFLPSSGDRNRDPALNRSCPLNKKEYQDLFQLQLLEDADFGMVPLDLVALTRQVKSKAKTKTTSGNQQSVVTREQTTTEVSRLIAERTYLLQKIQKMNRQLAIRAEGMKAYFEQELRNNAIQIQSLTSQNQGLLDDIQKKDLRIQQQDSIIESTQQVYTTQLEKLQIQNQTLQDEIKHIQKANSSEYEVLLQKEVMKYNKLDSENTILQKEMNKKDIKIKTLQRDIMSIQSQSSQYKDMLDAIQQRVALQEVNYHQDVVKLTGKYQQEIHDLQSRLVEIQSQSDASKNRVTELEAQVQRLQQQLEIACTNGSSHQFAGISSSHELKDVAVETDRLPSLQSGLNGLTRKNVEPSRGLLDAPSASIAPRDTGHAMQVMYDQIDPSLTLATASNTAMSAGSGPGYMHSRDMMSATVDRLLRAAKQLLSEEPPTR